MSFADSSQATPASPVASCPRERLVDSRSVAAEMAPDLQRSHARRLGLSAGAFHSKRREQGSVEDCVFECCPVVHLVQQRVASRPANLCGLLSQCHHSFNGVEMSSTDASPPSTYRLRLL